MNVEVEETDEPRANKGRFKRGQSGNPNGRPRKHRTALSHAVAKAQKQKVDVTEAGQRKRMTKAELGATQLANKAAAGDLSALRLMSQLEADATEELRPAPVRLKEDDIAIVARLVERIRSAGGGATSEEDGR